MSSDTMGTHDWPAVESYLTQQLQRLPPQGFITIDAVSATGAQSTGTRPRRLFGWLKLRQRTVRTHPLIQFSRSEDALQGECSGPETPLRSPTAYAWTSEQQNQLLALGWEVPDSLDDWHMFRCVLPLRDPDCHLEVSPIASSTAARLATATLRDVFGMGDPSGLQINVGRFIR